MNAAVKAVVQKEPQIKDTLILNRAVQKNQDVTYHYQNGDREGFDRARVSSDDDTIVVLDNQYKTDCQRIAQVKENMDVKAENASKKLIMTTATATSTNSSVANDEITALSEPDNEATTSK